MKRYFFLTSLVALAIFASQLPAQSDVRLEAGGCRVTFNEYGGVSSMEVNGQKIDLTAASMFQIMDARGAAAGSDFSEVETKISVRENSNIVTAVGEQNGINLKVEMNPGDFAVRCKAVLSSSDRSERSIVFRWLLPVDCSGWSWAGGLDEVEHIDGGATMQYATVIKANVRTSENGGLNTDKTGGLGNGTFGDKVGMGEFSPYPVACVYDETSGFAVGVDIEHPVLYRLLYIPGQGLAIEFDIGLSSGTFKFPNSAELSWVFYPVDPTWGYRSATEGYYRLFPEAFKKRVDREGIWMPFLNITTVENYEDFGFMFHETSYRPPRNQGDKSIAEIDREIGVYSFQYVEPWDIQIAAAKDGLDYDSAVNEEFPSGQRRESIVRSVAFDPYNQWIIRVMSAPWFDTDWALSYTTNPDPDLGCGSRFANVSQTSINPALEAGFDGVYFDSWEFFWPFDLNYRSDHFNTTDYPLSFSSSLESPRPAIWHYSSEYEMGKAIADSLHANGKLTMGNGFYNIPFTAGIMDLFGCEFEWPGNPSHRNERWAYFRTMASGKPIVVLLNRGMYSDAFTKEPYEGYDVYFNETLFWGVYPSFFSPNASDDPYWRNPDMYNAGRPWFKRFIPLIREVASSGWQPVTSARVIKGDVAVERFGTPENGSVYLTFRDPRMTFSGDVDVEINGEVISGLEKKECVELESKQKITLKKNSDKWHCSFTIKQGETKVLKLY